MRWSPLLWREGKGLPIGTKSEGHELGSRIAMPDAESDLPNFLTETIRQMVRETLKTATAENKVIKKPRIFSDLLSS